MDNVTVRVQHFTGDCQHILGERTVACLAGLGKAGQRQGIERASVRVWVESPQSPTQSIYRTPAQIYPLTHPPTCHNCVLVGRSAPRQDPQVGPERQELIWCGESRWECGFEEGMGGKGHRALSASSAVAGRGNAHLAPAPP